MHHLGPVGGPIDLYRFGDGNPEHLHAIIDHGPFPWWALPEVRLSFWRPLSSALTSFEVLVLELPVPLQHASSVLWYLALVAAVGAVFRRLLPALLAALALLVFAVDEAHFIPLAWLANRNAIVAAVPAFLALLFHLRWREEQTRWAMPASLACWAIALTAGEAAIGVMGYVAAYEAVAARGPLRRRALALAPVVLLLAGYALLYRTQGYGAWGSGVYLDPATQTGRWLAALVPRWLALTGAALLKVPSELGASVTWVHWVSYAAGLLAVMLFGGLARRLWPGLEENERRHARWLVLGAGLSIVPLASTFPSNRLLLIPSVGASVLVALVLRFCFENARRAAGFALVTLHLVLTAPGWALQYWVGYAAVHFGDEASINVELDPARVPTQRVAVIAPPDPLVGAYVGLMRQLNGLPHPTAWWPLTLCPVAQRLVRTGPSTLTLAPVEGRFLGSLFEQLFRGADHPMHTGDRVALAGLDVTVEAADEEGVERVAFTFDVPLDDPSLVFLVWRDGALRRYTPPPIGAAEVLPFEPTVPLIK
jgi:hypothetical protein